MLRLHDYVLSAECYKARLMLSLLGVGCETRAVDMYPGREHEAAAFRKLSPTGRLPVLEDGEIVLSDSAAILSHLASVYDSAGTWLPSKGHGLVVSWLSFASTDLAVLERARLAHLFGAAGDSAALAHQGRMALRALEDRMIERGIDGADWIVRNAPTIADIAAFPHVALSHDAGIGLEDYPALNLWQRRVRRLPGFVTMPGIPAYF